MIFGLISRWFDQVSVSEDYRRNDYVILSLLLAIGAFIRFWGLSNVGLHGDEETMAMPAMAILEKGEPVLPSGMYYARALLNIYMMSGSVWLFGESEWAFRLPSAIVGSLTGLAAFFMGRRFLEPRYNLAFVATIVFLPAMIEISQTARMYVFFVTCIIWFAACLFRWERDQKITSLIAALLVWMLALHFHQLSIFAAPLFLFPGLSRQSWAQLFQGALAFLIGSVFFFLYDNWISTKYPSGAERPDTVETESSQSAIDVLISGNLWIVVITIVVILAIAIPMILKMKGRYGWSCVTPVAFVLGGLISLVLLQYHAGILLLATGAVFWVRGRNLPRAWLILPLVVMCVITIIYLSFLHETGLYPGRQLVGAFIGSPSIWPVLRFLQYSPVAGFLYLFILIVAVRDFSSGNRLPVHFLFFAMAVWAPLLIIGFFAWNIPPRYAQGQLAFFLLCVFAGLAYLLHGRRAWFNFDDKRAGNVAVLSLVCVALVNPWGLIQAANPSYQSYPDHKGAAEFIESLKLSDGVVLIAEDVLQQTYYLGQVDYSLRPMTDARIFSIVEDGQVLDQYTGAPVLGSGSELLQLIDASAEEELYIIGSGENFVHGRRVLRGQGIEEALQSNRLEVVFTGRDGKTKIWTKRK